MDGSDQGGSVNTYDAFESAINATEKIVAASPGHFDDPTPCTEWDVRALLNHIVGAIWLWEGLLLDREPRVAVPPGGLPDTDVLGDDPASAYREAATAALAAARVDGVLAQPHPTPMGEMTGEMLAGFTTLDVIVHGWDLATAIGQPVAFDPEIVERVFGLALQAIPEHGRPPMIAAPVSVPAESPLIDRLVAYLGRTP